MPVLDSTRLHTKPALPASLQVAGKPQPRKMPYELNEYRDQHSSIAMLGALFRDIYTTGRPSSALGVLLSSYAMLRLGANSDMTNAVPIVHMSDEDYQWPADSGGRGRRYRPPYGAQNGSAPNLAWIRALAWEPRVTKMISLSPGSLGFIADPNQTVEFILALAQEWSSYSSVNFPRSAELRAYYLRTATDVIFRLTIHGAQTFSSRPSAEAEGHAQRYGLNRRSMSGMSGNPQMQQPPAPYLPDNALHLVSIWDEGKQKWLLSGLFLCPYGYAVSPSTWSMSPKDADLNYSQSQAHRIPSEKRINVDPLPDIVISGPTIQEPSPTKGQVAAAAAAAATGTAPNASSGKAGTAGTAYHSIAEHETHGPPVQGLGLLPALEADGDDELSGLDMTSAASESDDDPEDDEKTDSDSTEELEQSPAEGWPETPRKAQSMGSSPAIGISRAISPSRLVQMQNLGYDDSLSPQRPPFGPGSYHMDAPVPSQPASASKVPVHGPVRGPGPVLVNPTEMPEAPPDIPSRLSTPYTTEVSRSVSPFWPGAFPRSTDSSASLAVPPSPTPPASSGSSLRPWLWPFGGAKTTVIAGDMPVTPPSKTTHSGITEIFKTPQVPPASISVKAGRESTVVISPVTKDPPQTQFNAPATAAVHEHLSSSVLALSKLAKAQGMNLTEFMSMVLDTAEVAFKAS